MQKLSTPNFKLFL